MDSDGEGYRQLAISIVVQAIQDVRGRYRADAALAFLRSDWARFLAAGVMAPDAFGAFVERLAQRPDTHHLLVDALEAAYARRDELVAPARVSV